MGAISHGPLVDTNYYLVDTHGYTPYGVYEYYRTHEGKYFSVVPSSHIIFDRWFPRISVKGLVADPTWANEGDSLSKYFVKSGENVEKPTQTVELGSILSNYDRLLKGIGTPYRDTTPYSP